ncbi:hypothetical protein BT96DRAFT_621482 [Gymnopus androsaceus JB14]|uniref:Meiotically up-regulated protein Msb1/Mug8 domain-containing protein n=1 Tax=Gymnopus androsaceus JB14 TaxID=1447944 RepID=A0A6A4HWP1_9AGAR|nr:hypothetical protein BT96DRAFT_621482 [Gymnopus androsaceus JB14]
MMDHLRSSHRKKDFYLLLSNGQVGALRLIQTMAIFPLNRHVVLGLEQAARLVDVVSLELQNRGGLDTPFIFSTLSLDINTSAAKRLVKTFLGTCVCPCWGGKRITQSGNGEKEARFANMHELGTCLRWGLARIARVVDGVEVRGLLNWDHYIQWAEQEQALNYPPEHFRTFLPTLQTPLRLVLLTILSLLARLTAHGKTSGHSPPSLSPIFGPLLFGLGPCGLAFNHTYMFYLRSVNAMEHILLAFIRWQDTPDATGNYSNILTGGTVSTLGVPPRLKDWIKGYPAMLDTTSRFSSVTSEQRYRPRKGARTVRVTSVRRNVKAYERDLVKTAASWGESHRASGGSGTATPMSGSSGGFASSNEWIRISPSGYGYDTPGMPPRYSDSYRKRMNLPVSASPDIGFTYAMSTPPIDFNSPPPSAFTTRSAYSIASFGADSKVDFFAHPRLGNGGDRDYKSLSDQRWDNFENAGFGGLGVDDKSEKKLQFDLTESARAVRTVKRETLDWSSFSSSGFSRSDAPLETALVLSVPPQLSLNTSSISSPSSSPPITPIEANKKLRKKKTSGGPPAFSWDPEPVLGPEQIIEEAFVDVWCDLLQGSGWGEGLHMHPVDSRPCNWALVEFKALPFDDAGRPLSEDYSSDSDPRTSTSLLLLEEYVPGEYREQLATLHE